MRGIDFTQWARALRNFLAGGARPAPALPVAGAAETVRARPAPKPVQAFRFTPTRPRQENQPLVGRTTELERIIEAIADEDGHVVLYAERGRGKTSLSNQAVAGLRRRGAVVARHVCEAASSFDSIMQGLAADLPHALMGGTRWDDDGSGCLRALPDRAIRASDVAQLPRKLACTRLVFLIDEFDRVEDTATRGSIADTIKMVSDTDSGIKFMIVGVSTTLEEIIGQHSSIQRNIVAVHLPLLDGGEVAAMIEDGARGSGVQFPADAVALVTAVAGGMPYMANLLGLRILQSAMRRHHEIVQTDDLVDAVGRLISETISGVRNSYRELTSERDGRDMTATLAHVADAEQDRWGRIRVEPDGGGGGGIGVVIGGRRISGTAWVRLREAKLLLPVGTEGNLVYHADRALIYYVRLLAARERLTCEALVA